MSIGDGGVAMWADLTFIGRAQQRIGWTFNFHAPLAGARNLAHVLLDA